MGCWQRDLEWNEDIAKGWPLSEFGDFSAWFYTFMIDCVPSFYSYQAERKRREAQMRTQINQKLEESGERER